MGFSVLKTEWMGMGGGVWPQLLIDGTGVDATEDLRILGMRFDRLGLFDKHVDYWLERGLWVKALIGAVSRRFGSERSLGA